MNEIARQTANANTLAEATRRGCYFKIPAKERFSMYQACFDDSGRDTGSPFFLIAGYFGLTNDLVDLGDAWNRLPATSSSKAA
jgi:hypothetical protein